jgi:hypothetical protein
MYLQGDLQKVFDALFEMGVIEPLLEKDWKNSLTEIQSQPDRLYAILDVANSHQRDVKDLIGRLQNFEEQTIQYLAMEVAREYADFHARDEVH